MGLYTYEKVLWEIIYTVNKWRYYHYSCLFIIKTDHQSLKLLLEQRMTTFLRQKWLSGLLGYDYSIVYKKRVEKRVVDRLSRVFEGTESCNVLSLL